MWFSSSSSDIDFNRNWSEPVIHRIGDTLEDAATGKVYKQIGRILNLADVPRRSGIYLFRDNQDRTNVYCGKADNLLTRLPDHLNGKSGKLRRGEDYTIRWAVSDSPRLSEGVALLILEPERNGRYEWKDGIRGARPESILREAERLGLYSQRNSEKFCLKLLKFICEYV